MKIQTDTKFNKNMNFGAGKTTLNSDFDGTFMPKQYNHDAICRSQPPVEKGVFQAYFDAFTSLIRSANGVDQSSKFSLKLTTGRNLHETNYYFKKIKEQGLSIPLPESITISNGGDEFFRRKGVDSFSDLHDVAFLMQDVNHEKRNWVKTISGGWDGDLVKDSLKEFFAKTNKSDASQVQCIDAQTTQANMFYDNEMTLQGQLGKTTPIPQSYVGFRDDGRLNFHLALSSDFKPQILEIKSQIADLLKQKGIEAHVKSREEDGDSRDINGSELPTIKITPYVDNKELNKVQSIRRQVNEVVSGKTNDLVVVAGDDSNDLKMLNLFSYIDQKGAKTDFDDIEMLKKIHDLPVIAIFVDNNKGKTMKIGGVDIAQVDKYFNSDGNIRFIHVDPHNPQKPKNLIEATQLAIREYAKRNSEFAKNLSDDMKGRISKMDYEYPVDREFVKSLELKHNCSFDSAKNKTSEVISSASSSKPTIKNKSKAGIIIAGTLGVGAVATGVIIHSKKEKKN